MSSKIIKLWAYPAFVELCSEHKEGVSMYRKSEIRDGLDKTEKIRTELPAEEPADYLTHLTR
jgi:hypothetical protein